jgi:hypothetical protein
MLLLLPTIAPPAAPISAPVPALLAALDGATPEEEQPVSPATASAVPTQTILFTEAPDFHFRDKGSMGMGENGRCDLFGLALRKPRPFF